MIYLVIIVCISQIIHFIYYQKIMFSVKRRYRIIDSRISNLSQWITSNNQSTAQQLQKINELVYCLYIRTRNHDINSINQKFSDTKENYLVPLLTELSREDVLEKIKKEDMQYFYAALLQELQQLNKHIGKSQPSDTPLRPVNLNNETINLQDSYPRLNKLP